MSHSALVTRLLDTAQLRVPNIPKWLRDDLVLAAETIVDLRRQLDAKPRQPLATEDSPLPF